MIFSTSSSESVPDRLLQPQRVDDEVVVRLREIEPRLEYLLLLVQHVEVRAHADFQAELVRVVATTCADFDRLLEGLHLRDAVRHAGERRLREELRGTARGLEILPRNVLVRDRLR